MTEDEYYQRCEDWHTEPVEGCISCEVRAETQTCDNCGGSWDKGAGRGPAVCPTPHDPSDGRHVLRDGFGTERLCGMRATLIQRIPGFERVEQTCCDPITTPGADHCDFHQRQVDAVEAGRIYQRLVASR